jgi:membrane-bound inhibitor of C-type lysozyme
MFRTLAIAGGALLFLFGCTPKRDAEQSHTEIVSQSPEPPAQLAAKTDESPKEQPSDQQPAASADSPEVRYSCDDKRVVLARYGDEDVQLTIGGKTLRLPNVMAASGAKFMRKDGISPGKSLTWWTKGDEAMLIEAPSDAPPDSPDETIANCQSASPG